MAKVNEHILHEMHNRASKGATAEQLAEEFDLHIKTVTRLIDFNLFNTYKVEPTVESLLQEIEELEEERMILVRNFNKEIDALRTENKRLVFEKLGYSTP